MSETCGCFYPEDNGEGEETCECGHALDLHGDDGECTEPVSESQQ